MDRTKQLLDNLKIESKKLFENIDRFWNTIQCLETVKAKERGNDGR